MLTHVLFSDFIGIAVNECVHACWTVLGIGNCWRVSRSFGGWMDIITVKKKKVENFLQQSCYR